MIFEINFGVATCYLLFVSNWGRYLLVHRGIAAFSFLVTVGIMHENRHSIPNLLVIFLHFFFNSGISGGVLNDLWFWGLLDLFRCVLRYNGYYLDDLHLK